jgi:hypothetical protein
MRYSGAAMRRSFLNPLKPGQSAPFQTFRAAIADSGLPRSPLSGTAEYATPLALFDRILPRGAAT